MNGGQHRLAFCRSGRRTPPVRWKRANAGAPKTQKEGTKQAKRAVAYLAKGDGDDACQAGARQLRLTLVPRIKGDGLGVLANPHLDSLKGRCKREEGWCPVGW